MLFIAAAELKIKKEIYWHKIKVRSTIMRLDRA